MGAGMARGRTPRKPRAAAVAPADLGLDPEAAGAREKLDEQKVPVPREAPKPGAADVALTDTDPEYLVQKDASTITPVVDVLEAPKPGAADVALTDTDPEVMGAANLARGKRDEKDSSTSAPMVEVLKTPRVEVPGQALKTDEEFTDIESSEESDDVSYQEISESETENLCADHENNPTQVQTIKTENTNPELDDRASDAKSMVSDKDSTSTTKKAEGPRLAAAKIEASAAKAKVEQLRLAAIKLKCEGIKPMDKLTKVARWASDASDRRILSEYLDALEETAEAKEGNPSAFVPRPRLQRFRINPRLNVSLTHLSERKQLVKPGIDLVMIEGSFAVPSSFVSGNCHIDAMNFVLFDILMSINALLAGEQSVSTVASFGLEVPETEDAKADIRAAVQELRKAAHNIRNSVIDVGGLPLREPALYWREAFPDTMV